MTRIGGGRISRAGFFPGHVLIERLPAYSAFVFHLGGGLGPSGTERNNHQDIQKEDVFHCPRMI